MHKIDRDADEAKASAAASVSALYRSEHLAMVRLARLIVGSAAVAEEVTHDAFVSVLEHFDTIDNPGAYLRQVVVNNCRTTIRRSTMGQRKSAQLASLENGRQSELGPELDEAWHALELVTPKQRVALVLRFYSDQTVNDIAELMGERPGTIKSLIHRGLATLRKELSP